MSASLLLLAEHHAAVRRLLADGGTEDTYSTAYQRGRKIGILLCIASGILGFLRATRVRNQLGRSPWGLDPWAWAIFCCLLPIVGRPALFFACRSARAKGAAEPLPAPYTPAESLPAPFVPALPTGPEAVAAAWAAPEPTPAAVVAFPEPTYAPVSGARTAIDVLPAAKPRRRFR